MFASRETPSRIEPRCEKLTAPPQTLTPDWRSPTLFIATVIAFTAGIGAAAQIPSRPDWLLPPFFLVAVAVFMGWRHNHGLQHPLLFCFFLLCGLLHGSVGLAPPTNPAHLYHQFATEGEATLSGTIIEAPTSYPDKTKFVIAVDGIIRPPASGDEAKATIAFPESLPPFLPATGTIELAMRSTPLPELIPGARLLARARISRPHGYATPGSFDYPAFLAQKSIYATGWISSPSLIRAIAPTHDASFFHRLLFLPELFRHRINLALDATLPPGHSGLYKAILTGDRSTISPETQENFTATGAVHLLSISGLHMGLVAIGLGWVINLLLRRSTWLLLHFSVWKLAAMLTLPLLLGYALIAGFQTPVTRALIMTTVFLLAVVFDRQWHVPTNIAIAALLILILHPTSLFTVSFQLSFAAVIAMAAILPHITGTKKYDARQRHAPSSVGQKLYLATKGSILVSCAATAGTLPLLVWHFNRFSPLSALSTLLIEPFLCFWALPLGLISCPLLFLAPELATILLKIGAPGLDAAVAISAFLASLPFSSVWLPTPSWPEIMACYLLFTSLLFLKKHRIAPAAGLLSLLVLIGLPAGHHLLDKTRRDDRVAILDVGQGNAVVVSLAGGGHALIDGGGAASDRFDPGRNIIAPYLWRQRISRLEAVVVSHPDADHYNGLFFILERFRPRTLWINGQRGGGARYAELIRRAAERGIDVRIPDEDEILLHTPHARLTTIADYHRGGGGFSENGKSLVITLESRGKRFLFPGDIDQETEKRLVDEGKRIKADVLLLPHHGSDSSSSAAFLARVAPGYTVVSAGKSTRKTFPAAAVIQRCQQAGCTIGNTAVDGTITFAVTETELITTTFAGNITLR